MLSNPNSNPNNVVDGDSGGDGVEARFQQQLKKKARERERRQRTKYRKMERKLMMHQTPSFSEAGEGDENPNPQKGIEKIFETTQNEPLTMQKSSTDPHGGSEKIEKQQLRGLSNPQAMTGAFTTIPPSPCGQVIDMGAGLSPSGSKRKRGATPDDASTKAKDSTIALASVVNLPSQPPIWTPEFFLGGNPRMGSLRADQSALTEEVAVGLIYGARLPADIAYFAQYKDAWEIYSTVAKCLSGVIGATAELHNRATRVCPPTLETEKLRLFTSKLEEELALKKSELEEASKKINKQAEKINKQAEKIVNQARYIEGLVSSHGKLKKELAKKDVQCKNIEQQYDKECKRYKELYNAYNQLQCEKKELQDAPIEVAHVKEQYERTLACEKEVALINATLEASQIRQSTCDPIRTAFEVGIPSSAFDPPTRAGNITKDEVVALPTITAAIGEVPPLMQPQFSSDGEVSPSRPFLDLQSEEGADTYMGERKEEVEPEPGSCSKGVENELAPKQLATKL